MKFGFFGKLPIKGDFLKQNLSTGFVDDWDLWLQASMSFAKEVLGERWDELYYGAPVWRFFLADGAVSEPGAYVGLLIPSTDRVGRAFPLTLAAPLRPGEISYAQIQDVEPVLAALEVRILSLLLRPVYEFDEFLDAISVDEIALDSDGSLESCVVGLAEAASLGELWSDRSFLARVRAVDSLWWTRGSDVVPPQAVIGPSALHAELFVALILGRQRCIPPSEESHSG